MILFKFQILTFCFFSSSSSLHCSVYLYIYCSVCVLVHCAPISSEAHWIWHIVHKLPSVYVFLLKRSYFRVKNGSLASCISDSNCKIRTKCAQLNECRMNEMIAERFWWSTQLAMERVHNSNENRELILSNREQWKMKMLWTISILMILCVFKDKTIKTEKNMM